MWQPVTARNGCSQSAEIPRRRGQELCGHRRWLGEAGRHRWGCQRGRRGAEPPGPGCDNPRRLRGARPSPAPPSRRARAAGALRPPWAGLLPPAESPPPRCLPGAGGRGRPSRSGPGSAAHGGMRGTPPGPALPPRLRAGRLRDRPTPPGAARWRRSRRPGGPLLLLVRRRGDGGGAPRRSVVPAEPRRARGLHGRGRQHGAAVRRGGRPRAAGAVPAAEGRLGAEQEPLRVEPPHASGQVQGRGREGSGPMGSATAIPASA